MYEHHSHKLLPLPKFAWRLARHLMFVGVLIVFSLAIGMTGYRQYARMSWVDAFLNSSMLLGGMGPVGELTNDRAKIFAGCYALYAGLIFIVSLSVVMAPIVHRVLHALHADETRRKTTKS
jgi:hypothetical protein